MHGLVRRRLEMAYRVRDFCRQHPVDDAGFAAALERLERQIAELETLVQSQIGGTADHRSTVRRRQALRQIVWRQLVLVARAAAVAEPDDQALEIGFRLPRFNVSTTDFLTHAQAVLQRGRTMEATLLRGGLPDRLLDELARAMDALRASVSDSGMARSQHVGSAGALRAVSRSLLRVVALLDATYAYRLASEPALLAAWRQTRHVVRTSSRGAIAPPAEVRALPKPPEPARIAGPGLELRLSRLLPPLFRRGEESSGR
jgi:hypothetical protein